MTLTPQREKFCQEIANCKNQAEAYILAYPKAAEWKRNAVDSQASQLMKDSKIIERLKELRQPLIEKFNYTLEDSLRKIVEIQGKAFEDGDYKSSLKAEEMKVKMLGLGIDNDRGATATTLINEQNNSQVNIIFTTKPQEVSNGE